LNGELRVEQGEGYAAHITFPLQPAATWDAKS
jgi:hypothetical protein